MPQQQLPHPRLPPEVIYDILYMTLYGGHEFSARLEYEDLSSHHHPFSINHLWFKDAILITNKEFYTIGITLLWRFLIVRSMSCLQEILRQATMGAFLVGPGKLGSYTRRLQLRLQGSFNVEPVVQLLAFMGELKVFVWRNQSHHLSQPPPFSQRRIVDALVVSSPKLIRVQLDSPEQQIDTSDVRSILTTIPELVTLRLFTVRPGATPLERMDPGEERVESGLKSLSIGPDYGIEEQDAEMPGLASTFAMLYQTMALPKLTRVILFAWTPATSMFLEAYGTQLKFLLYSTATRADLDGPNFLDPCPRLRELVWLVSDPSRLAPSQHLPSRHSTIRTVHVMLIKHEATAPSDYAECIQNGLRTLREGDFPHLKKVFFHERGDELSDVGNTTWFRYYGRSLRKNGVTLEMSDLS